MSTKRLSGRRTFTAFPVFPHFVAFLAYWILCTPGLASQTTTGSQDFKDVIVPIFEKHCIGCHNNQQKSGDLSLESSADFLAFRSEDSELDIAEIVMQAITPSNGEAEMPQDASPLSADEIEAIQRWFVAGAKWPKEVRISEPQITDLNWWSYQPIGKPVIPSSGTWAETPVDSFVLDNLSRHGLSPSQEADRRTLIRRLTYDLLGLPPTPEEIARFENDEGPDAYERLVDQLLSSPQYGERWARHWLDVVKYADTCGYDKDKLRINAWPYRDYVIQSFNSDKSYNRFVREQLAGDVLYPGTADGILGLGFIAAGPWDHIGHVEVPESKLDGQVARYLDRDDMVSNTLNSFASVTIQCARCHNHKSDQITQDHYFGLQSVFAAVDRAERLYDEDPTTNNLKEQLKQTLASESSKLTAIASEITNEGGQTLSKLTSEFTKLSAEVVKPIQHGYHSAIAQSHDEEKWIEVRFPNDQAIASIELYPSYDEYAGIGAGFGFPVRFRIEYFRAGMWKTLHDQTTSDLPKPSFAPFIVESNFTGSRIRITATHLAKRKNDFNFALAELRIIDTQGRSIAGEGEISTKDSIESPARWSKANLTDGLWPHHPDPSENARLVGIIQSRSEILQELNTPARVKRREQAKKAIDLAQQELNSLPAGKYVYAAATDFKPQGNFKPTRGKLRHIQVLHRGNIDHPLHDAQPGFLPLPFNDDPKIAKELGEHQRRAELARWLTDDQQPLVWRSIANRLWQYHFGRGIVDTPNDFGRMGSAPTHPLLLDWLASEIKRTQSLKHLHRLIVTSNVYRQACTERAEAVAIDQENRLLWRMPRRRLEAEEIRDSILAVSGALRNEMGGPGFFLFELEKTDHSPHYEYHKFDPSNPESHKRSVYRFIVRSQPDPWMTTLDCADSSQSTPTRSETLTPGQSLALLNNAFNLEMAKVFSKRLKNLSGKLETQVFTGLELVLQREPEREMLDAFVNYSIEHGLENTCRILFNLNEFIFVD